MGGPSPDWTIPDPENLQGDDLDAIRRDLHPALIAAVLCSGGLVASWDILNTTFTNDNLTRIDWVDTVSGQQLRIDYTYIGSRINTAKFQWDYNDGGGFEDFSPNTATLSYNADGIVIGVTWSVT